MRSQLKREHIAATHLRQEAGIEVFLPRIRFKRATRLGPFWTIEALFPGYLFARFDWHKALRQVHHARGVAGVVHFGARWPTLPNSVIDELRRLLGADALFVADEIVKPGDEVQITGGPFHGLDAVVQHALPARKRVAVLLHFLGRQTTVEVDSSVVVPKRNQRAELL